MLVCDRIEGAFAILIDQDGKTRKVPLSRFDKAVCEGDVFSSELVFDPTETENRRKRIHALFEKLKKKGE